MTIPNRFPFRPHRSLILSILALVPIVACTTSVKSPTGPAAAFQRAQSMFRQNNFDRALGFTDDLASASPPNQFTLPARVLRAVIFDGQIKAYKELAEGYSDGAKHARNSSDQASLNKESNDNLQSGAQAALHLGELVQWLNQRRSYPKEVVLETHYPAAEGPMHLTDLDRVRMGGVLGSQERQELSKEALSKGVDEALAQFVGGDRTKARSALASGSFKLGGVDFAIFLGKSLLEGSSLFDDKHLQDPEKLKIILGEAETVVRGGQGLLGTNPNENQEKALKDLLNQIKAASKNA